MKDILHTDICALKHQTGFSISVKTCIADILCFTFQIIASFQSKSVFKSEES